MTKIIQQTKYCNKCKRQYEVPVLLSTNSYHIKQSPELRNRFNNGDIFKNYCPVCKEELVDVKDE
jgi:uncharacterized protein YbaR (Trm112 family)